jgi:hypothetical protein
MDDEVDRDLKTATSLFDGVDDTELHELYRKSQTPRAKSEARSQSTNRRWGDAIHTKYKRIRERAALEGETPISRAAENVRLDEKYKNEDKDKKDKQKELKAIGEKFPSMAKGGKKKKRKTRKSKKTKKTRRKRRNTRKK